MKETQETINLDNILEEIGEFGTYQARIYILMLFPILSSAIYASQFVFMAEDVNYRCQVPECESPPFKFETNGWGTWAYPDEGGKCERFKPIGSDCESDSFHHNETVKCDAWVYERNTSIVTTFDLACKDWKRTLVGSIHSAGLFVALPLTAYVSDTFGRRVVFLATAVAPGIIGILRSFSSSYITYLLFEFLDSVAGSGVYSSGFILALEMMGLKRRVLGGNVISCVFALGQAATALMAWAVPDWRTLTRILYAPSFVFIVYYFFLEESVRWLLSKGNKKEAARIIFKVAEVNEKKLSPETIKLLTKEDSHSGESKTELSEKSKESLAKQVLRSKVIVSRLLICSVWWISVTFIYYGLSINSVSLAGNRYVNYILTSLIEIPGYFMSVITLDRFGRKSSIMTSFFICGTSLICLPYIPSHLIWLKTCLTLLAKLCISMSFSSIYIYTSELYPTQVRASLLAACSFCGRLGQMVAPQTPLLMKYMESLPYLIFGFMAALSGCLMLLTPETLHITLPDTIKQAENIAVLPRTNRRTDIIVD